MARFGRTIFFPENSRGLVTGKSRWFKIHYFQGVQYRQQIRVKYSTRVTRIRTWPEVYSLIFAARHARYRDCSAAKSTGADEAKPR